MYRAEAVPPTTRTTTERMVGLGDGKTPTTWSRIVIHGKVHRTRPYVGKADEGLVGDQVRQPGPSRINGYTVESAHPRDAIWTRLIQILNGPCLHFMSYKYSYGFTVKDSRVEQGAAQRGRLRRGTVHGSENLGGPYMFS